MKLSGIISPKNFRALAEYLTKMDEINGTVGSTQVQGDLIKFADALEKSEQNQSSYEPLKKEILAKLFRDEFDRTYERNFSDFDTGITVIQNAEICDVDSKVIDEMINDLAVNYPRAVKAWKEERNVNH